MSLKIIGNLDVNSLEMISSFLTVRDRLALETVSKTMRNLLPYSWKDIKTLDFSVPSNVLGNFYHNLPPETVVTAILSRCLNLRDLTLGRSYSTETVSLLPRYCPNLQTLNLNLPAYNKESFHHDLQQLQKLKSITISNYMINDNEPSGSKYNTKVLEYLPNGIEKISFSHWDAVDAGVRLELTENFPRIYESWTHLRSFTLSNWRIVDQNIMEIITRKQSLTHFSLENCLLINLGSIGNLINLEYLNLKKLTMIEVFPIKVITEKLKKLKHFEIDHYTEVPVEALKHLSNLEHLKEIVINTTQVNDEVLNEFQDLKILECGHAPIFGVTDVSVMRILRNSPNLERLNVCRTRVTIETLNCAFDVTKNRKEKKLHIIADSALVDRFKQSHSDCGMLILEGRSNWLTNERRNNLSIL